MVDQAMQGKDCTCLLPAASRVLANIEETRASRKALHVLHAMVTEHGVGGSGAGDRRPGWAAEYETAVVWEDANSRKRRVQSSMKTLLITPHGAQRIAPKALRVLDFFDEFPAYSAPPTDDIS